MISLPQKAILAAAGALSLMAACKRERDPCLEPRTVNLHAHARHHADTGTVVTDTFLTNPLLVALDATSGTNAFLYTTKTADLTFSLSNVADSTRWLIRPDSANAALQDTITFYYNRQLHFLSNACGYTYFYSLQRIATTHNAIDSALIGNPDVTSTANVEHVKIYY